MSRGWSVPKWRTVPGAQMLVHVEGSSRLALGLPRWPIGSAYGRTSTLSAAGLSVIWLATFEEEISVKLGPDMLEFLVDNRTINGTASMLIDLDRCTRCDDCVRACASTHNNNPRFIRHGREILLRRHD